jgi:hypothetical protein
MGRRSLLLADFPLACADRLEIEDMF